jgi:hypothetical protein
MGSGYKSFTAGAVLTASDVNNYLMEQGVMYFATTTARDTAISSPEDGMVAYIGSNDANEGLYTYNGTAWRKGPGWNAPWGQVALVTLATVATYASPTWGFPFPWNGTGLIANRLYKATVDFAWGIGTLVGQVDFGIGTSAGAGIDRQISIYQDIINAPRQTCHSVTFTTTAGSMTRGLSIRKSTGGGNIDVLAGSTLLIEDIGPAGAPA